MKISTSSKKEKAFIRSLSSNSQQKRKSTYQIPIGFCYSAGQWSLYDCLYTWTNHICPSVRWSAAPRPVRWLSAVTTQLPGQMASSGCVLYRPRFYGSWICIIFARLLISWACCWSFMCHRIMQKHKDRVVWWKAGVAFFDIQNKQLHFDLGSYFLWRPTAWIKVIMSSSASSTWLFIYHPAVII